MKVDLGKGFPILLANGQHWIQTINNNNNKIRNDMQINHNSDGIGDMIDSTDDMIDSIHDK